MAALLYQRGKLVLHGSCVCVQGEAVAFLGESGWGKSSLAAAFFLNGYPVVADDLAAVDQEAGKTWVSPGFPQLKIRPELLVSLGHNSRTLFFLDEVESKLGLDVSPGFPVHPLPLKRIYVLSETIEQDIQPIPPQQAVLELIRHSYPTRTLHPGDALHLRQCADLARTIPLYWLKPSQDLAALSDLVALVADNHVA
jgi:hypothetical protein